MVKVTHSVLVARPKEAVYAFVAEEYFDHARQWHPGTSKLIKTAPGPVGRGTTGYEELTVAGKPYERSFAITDWIPGRRMQVVSIEDPSKETYRCTYTFVTAGVGTVVTVELEIFMQTPLFKFMETLAARAIRKDLEERVGTLLKRAVERSLLVRPAKATRLAA
jgi:hypothetical protein